MHNLPIAVLDISIDNHPIGKIKIKLRSDVVPQTVKNFIELCQGSHDATMTYKNSHFHRIIPGFMMQGGDFTNGDGTGGKSIYGDRFNDENFNLKHDQKGVISMANAGPHTNGSQFFITFIPTPHLDGHHVVFGSVIEGDEVLQAVEAVGTQSGQPIKKVEITSCTIEQ